MRNQPATTAIQNAVRTENCWDVLHWFETYPKRVPDGYVCRECPEDDRPIFPSREALWRAEVFGPFLEWVNHDLANSVAVSVSGTPDSVTWARLVPITADKVAGSSIGGLAL